MPLRVLFGDTVRAFRRRKIYRERPRRGRKHNRVDAELR